jgi:hypothetical protein
MQVKSSKPFAILQPVHTTKPEIDPSDVVVGASLERVKEWWESAQWADTVVFDVETRGTDPWRPATAVVGVGCAWDRDGEWHAVYFDVPSMGLDAKWELFARIGCFPYRDNQAVIAHNAYFDFSLLKMESSRLGLSLGYLFTHDTYGLYKQLAGEGWWGQTWGLKDAQLDLLGWDSSNEDGIDGWLLGHGYHKQGPPLKEGVTPEQHLAEIRAWEAAATTKPRSVAPMKGEMWRVPPKILGEYCILDCLSTMMLYQFVLRPALNRFPELEQFHTDEWIEAVHLLSDQQLSGIRMDRDKLLAHKQDLEAWILQAEADIRRNEYTGPIIKGIEIARLAADREKLAAAEPPKFKKKKETTEPVKFKKNGELASSWVKWDEKRNAEPEVYKSWNTWRVRLDELSAPRKPWSPTSGDDIRELIYYHGLVDYHSVRPYDPETRKGCDFRLIGINGEVELSLTDADQLPVDAEALSQMNPEWAGNIDKHREYSKELSYVETYLELLHNHGTDEAPEWRLHPGWKIHGTVTGRLAGRDPNLQQIPKSLALLDCFISDPESAWVEGDWTALEPHVLAELSRDPALMDLYGPDAKPGHDRYLFTLASIEHAFTAPVRRLYDPKNPTKESVGQAKKECKSLREVGKVLVLSGDYGAGAGKKWRACILKGIKIELDQMKEIHNAQLDMHRGVYKEFIPELEREWRARGGWVLSGLGHPVCVDGDKTKDLCNRVIQKTGHDIHTIYFVRLARALRLAGIECRGIVWDFHDQFIIQVPRDRAGEVLALAVKGVADLNADLGTTVRLKLEPRIVSGMSEAKMEEAFNEREARRTVAPMPKDNGVHA